MTGDTDMEPEAGDVTSEAGAKLEVGDVTGDTDMGAKQDFSIFSSFFFPSFLV